ncbi:MAG: ribonuclease H-like domain-containing protein [Anaerohalosphaeraceae bacterium]
MRCYLDIETTGLSPKNAEITVVGLALERGPMLEVIQLVSPGIEERSIRAALEGVTTIYTYNGHRFDLPFLRKRLGIHLEKSFVHCDLMFSCWQQELKGGLKRVEQKLNIRRRLKDINGWMAVQLWRDYTENGDPDALQTLLDYNQEDVVNLQTLRIRLNIP